jgi:hypothetical protein
MQPDPTDLLVALQRFFLLHYREEAQRRHPGVWDLFPLAMGSRIDVVLVNGGDRAHFYYSRRTGDEHVVHIHHVTLAGHGGDETAERRFLDLQFARRPALAHMHVLAPFEGAFDRMAEHARAAVEDHVDEIIAAP